MLLKEFVENYAKHIWPTGGDHRELQLRRMRRVIDGLGADTDLSEIRLMHIQDFLMGLDCAASTKNQYASAISKVLHYAYENRLIDHVPTFKGVYSKKLGQRKRVMRDYEIAMLINYFNRAGARWMAHMVILADQTGLRKGSILEIGKTAQLVEQENVTFCHIPHSKNGDEIMVPLNEYALKSYEEFARLRSNYTDHAFRQLWEGARNWIAKDDKEFVFHSIRRTVATRLAAANVSAVNIAKMLNHRSLQTTQKYMMDDNKRQIETAELLKRH